ncbi:MAG: transcriptional regulator [Candidatus Margulisiibacteriota bacterium]|nr:MAG: hypothetical protein A2X43_11570 [Candidatus Margulisbacteria bacterium GWD2_39_127]PZM84813.1 MAG: transcriptional regulator [Candidatus Margulisiibacteriota bacterium]HAR64339.1 transcriptional regulator [Candidatus Margulisiibacteriota bacterium]HCY36204.1 transcriptional regulator [Candidatus Margulisiibacteriota bacterium]
MIRYDDHKKEVSRKYSEEFRNYDEEYEDFKLQAIGEMIKEERKKAGLTQEELANAIHTKKSAISRIEKHTEDIKISTLVKVSKALGKNLEFSFR